MPKYVVADTSIFIIFHKVNQLDLLKDIYQVVYTTPEIVDEYNAPLPDWVKIESVEDKKYQTFVNTLVDSGEASAIAFAMEKEDTLLIVDDLKARKLAAKLGLKYTGTLGVINRAKEQGLITEIKPLLEKLQQTDFRVSDKIIKNLLKRNGE